MSLHYTLKCLGTGQILSDDLLPLSNPDSQEPAFLRTEYKRNKLIVGADSEGLYKYADWLPIRRRLKGSSAPATYRSNGLAKRLSLTNLHITFSGFWPEKNVAMTTGTFKECEAFSVCARLPENFDKTLVVASAGNTARAFAKVCSENQIPLVLVVPEQNLDGLWFTGELDECVKLIAAGGPSDYYDAIRLSQIICEEDGFVAEGGAKNVARRDGMSTTVLSAASMAGEIPEYYFQAVGSGTGAIAAWEANLRLLGDGRFGSRKMKLMLSQNAPFMPIYESWKRGTRELIEPSLEDAGRLLGLIHAHVLSNRKPPYGIVGGLYDALTDTDGDMFKVENGEAIAAGKLFEECESIDIAPAAAVALASLINAVNDGIIGKDAFVMLNITGGGVERLRRENRIRYLTPHAVIPFQEISKEGAKSGIRKIKGAVN